MTDTLQTFEMASEPNFGHRTSGGISSKTNPECQATENGEKNVDVEAKSAAADEASPSARNVHGISVRHLVAVKHARDYLEYLLP